MRPALKAIIQSLLPGLDEETSEEFERAYSILNRFKDISGCGSGRDHNIVDASNDQYFWQCLFLVSITSSSRRQGALAYLNRNLPKLGTSWRPFPASPSTITEESDRLDKEELPPEIEAVASPEPGLLVRCFATGLCDGQLLIQRGFLDLLVTHLPLHSAVLRRKVTSEDLEKLVAAAVSVVARREMSLNRRLWAWFLGPELLHQRRDSSSRDSDDGSTSEPHDDKTRSEYFQRYGLAPLISSIKKMLTADRIAPSFKARPFRICLSLMDRWEIGEFVVPQIFLEALSSVWRYQKTAPSKESFNEVLRSATVFFDGVESRLIWAEITKILLQTLQAESFSLQDGQDRLDLVLFIITKFNVREEEMLNVHIPIATLLLLTCIQPTLFGPIVDLKPAHGALIRSSLNICSHLVDLIPQRAFSNSSHNKALTNINDLKSRDRSVLHIIQEFYNSRQGAADVCDQVVPAKDLGAMLLDEAIQMVTHDLNRVESAANIQTELSILEKLIRKIPDIASLDWEKLLTLLMTTSKDLTTHMNSMFQTISTIVFALEVVLLALPSVSLQYDYQIRQIVPNLIVCLWPYLSPSQPEYNVEAARCILRLQKISPENRLVESSITTLMINEGLQNQRNKLDTESGRRFITLWAHVMSTTNGSQTSHPNFLFSKSSNIKESNEVNIDTIILARPLLLLLDSLSDTKTEIFIFSSGWISSVPNLQM